jgi:hypothetical protein
MDHDVLLEITTLSKSLFTYFTFVWLITSVMSVVVQERPFVFTDLSASLKSADELCPVSLGSLVRNLDDFELET